MKRALWLLCLVCGLAAQEPLDEDGLAGLLDKVEAALAPVRSLRVGFVQEKHLLMFDDMVRAEGQCCFVRPDKVRFEITAPFRSVLVSSGEEAAKYEHLDGGWERLELPHPDAVLAVTSQIAAWMGGDFTSQEERYALTGYDGPRPRLELRPKGSFLAGRIEVIEVVFDAGLTRIDEVILREPGDDFTRLCFGEEERDAALPDELFDPARARPLALD